MKSIAPIILVIDTPSSNDAPRKLLTYCFPWINVVCRVPLPISDNDHPTLDMTREDLECCDSFFLDFVSLKSGIGSGDPGDSFREFEEVLHTEHSSLRWYALRSGTVCSRCGWTRGETNGTLTLRMTNADFHVLIFPAGLSTGQPLGQKVRLMNTANDFGDFEGLETAIVRHVARKFNFTLSEFTMKPGAVRGLYPDEDLNGATKSLLTRLLSRKIHMTYGDLTIEATRSLYGDFSFPFDIGYMAAVSKVTEDKHSLAALIDRSCIVWYIILSSSLALFLSRQAKPCTLSIVVRNTMSMVLRPLYPSGILHGLVSSNFIGKFVITLHALCALVITAVISGVTMNMFSRKTFSGLLNTETQALEALSAPDAKISLDVHMRDLFAESNDRLMKRIIEKHEICANETDCLRDCLNSPALTCLNFAEAFFMTDILLRNDALESMQICPALGFNILQGFLFNKGCFLSRIFSREILIATEMHLIALFKINAGVQTYTHKESISSVFKEVTLEAFEDLAAFYCYAWASAIIALLIEIALPLSSNFLRSIVAPFIARALNLLGIDVSDWERIHPRHIVGLVDRLENARELSLVRRPSRSSSSNRE